jgi:hypothetical protein
MNAGSFNLRRYRIARRDGATVDGACELSGIALSEALLIEHDDLKNPPSAEAYELPETHEFEMRDGRLSVQFRGITMPQHNDTADHDTPEDPLIELAGETLRGDIRDSLLAWFKAQPKSWPFMAEREQRDLADAADRYAKTLITQACKIIAAGERPCIVATLVEYREKDGVEAKLKLPSKGEVVSALHEACGREVLIVTSGAEEFQGEAGGPVIDADNPKFPNLGDEYAEAA